MNPQSSIKVKLLSNGRYTWEIQVFYQNDKKYLVKEEGIETISVDGYGGAVQEAKEIDTELRSQFPLHTMPSSARTVELED